MGVDGSLRESRDRTKGKRPRKEQRLVTIIYDDRYLGGRKKLTLITEIFCTYMEPLCGVSIGCSSVLLKTWYVAASQAL